MTIGMHPLVRAAVAAALLAAVGALGKTAAPRPAAPLVPGKGVPGVPAACRPGTLPEGDACIPLPRPGASLPLDMPAPRGEALHELIPRRPDRPAALSAYRFPIGAADAPPELLSSLEPPGDGADRALLGAAPLSPVSIELAGETGDEIIALALDGQEGPAEVVMAGELFGATIVTAHLVRDGGLLRQFLLFHGNLDREGMRAVVGAPVEPGDVIGVAGDSARPGRVGLYFEVRQLREGMNLGAIEPARLLDAAVTIPCDPRNVLPLREGQGASL
jgi:hypothetical protein